MLALTLTICYHAKAADSFLLAFDFGANWQTVVLRSTAKKWLWRLATFLVNVPQSYAGRIQTDLDTQ